MRMCISGFSLCYCKGCNLQNDLFMLLIPPICLVDLLLPTWRWAWKYKDFRYYHNSRMEFFKSQGRKFEVKNLKRMWFTKWLIHPICLVDLLLPTWRWARKYKDFRYYHNSRSSCLKLQEVQTTHRENIVGMNTRKLFVGSDDGFYINLMQRIHKCFESHDSFLRSPPKYRRRHPGP